MNKNIKQFELSKCDIDYQLSFMRNSESDSEFRDRILKAHSIIKSEKDRFKNAVIQRMVNSKWR